MDFHKTSIGKKFYEVDFPRAVGALETIAASLASISAAEQTREKVAKMDKIKENKSTRVKAVLEKKKTKAGLQKTVLLKKISEMKDDKGNQFFDKDFLKKMFNKDEGQGLTEV